ncbi:type II toxin-antitoxin system RelE/ParE family toxin [Maricaulis sp.]|uniref:type II toxin-antitoxin system RelE/ParE family toxin n=1 Tax=Maricaulis sp. TaxID=1486257 RepID=UPI003A93BE8A
MKLVFSDMAQADLEEIGDYIASDNPIRALSFIAELRSRCATLTEFPESGPVRPDLGEGMRSITHRAYVILYRTGDDAVRVERILQGNRAFPEA